MNNLPQPQRTGRTRRSTLPKSRSLVTNAFTVLASLLSLFVAVFTNQGPLTGVEAIFVIFGVVSLFWIILELTFRFLNVCEEYQHLHTRYENSVGTLVRDVFYFSQAWLAILATAILIISNQKYAENPVALWYQMGPSSQLASLFFGFYLERCLNLRSGPLYDSLWIENSNGLDYGSAMAQSFFFGYLKLIIPKTGNKEKYLKELMIDYESRHQVTIEFHKLFILIPKSLYCQTSLKNDYNPSIEESSSLDDKVMDVAAVRNRVYKNSVYKIKDGDNFVYVCAEYATPLKTFKDGRDHNGQYSSYYEKHKNGIVLQFYKTLSKVLKEHVDCTNFVELIFYDDKDENGVYKDVGQVLLARIRKLQSRSRPR